MVGNGIEFGEFGGAIEIVFRARQYVNYAWIRRIPPTKLTRIFLDATGAKDEMDLMEGFSNNYYHVFPYMAIQIVEAAREGDQAACDLIRWSGEELGWLAVSVARQIGMEQEEVEIVQSGSVFNSGELIDMPMRQVILEHVPRAKIRLLEHLPVIGPVILAMLAAGMDGYPLRAEMVKTSLELMAERNQ